MTRRHAPYLNDDQLREFFKLAATADQPNAVRLTAFGLAASLAVSERDARRILQRVETLLTTGETTVDVMRRLNPRPGS